LRGLISEIPETDWQEIEIVGWLYQFYISEKKSQVIGKVVKSEDIPAATQLFTPNWIVKYMVQNTLGRKWLMTYPDSSIKDRMEFYIQPAEQDPEVQAHLDSITPGQLNPEELTFMDPACGSGHILAEAYELFKDIYQERGYRTRDIPRLILEKNLYGLEIDDRAAQLARFTLFMKARADDRRILNRDRPVRLNVMAVQETNGLDAQDLEQGLLKRQPGTSTVQVSRENIESLLQLFQDGKTFGSLLTVPGNIKDSLPALENLLVNTEKQDAYARSLAETLAPLVHQARLLAEKYDFVVANPPYMGSGGLNSKLKKFAKDNYPDSKSDLFAMFIERNLQMTKDHGFSALITMQSWMFLSSFEKLRNKILDTETIITMAHLGARAFDSISGEVVQTTTFVLFNERLEDFKGTYLRLTDEKSEEAKIEGLKKGEVNRFFVSASDFKKIPGSPIAYWVSENIISGFECGLPLYEFATPRAGMITGNNSLFVRFAHEVSAAKISLSCSSRVDAQASKCKWFPYQKGGPFRKYYGNLEYVVDWENDGKRLRTMADENGKIPAHAFNEKFIFRANVNWSAVTSGFFSVRLTEKGCLFDASGSAAFPDNTNKIYILAAFLNSPIARAMITAINPTLNFQAWEIGNLPILHNELTQYSSQIQQLTKKLRMISKTDWDSYETSWDFTIFPLLNPDHKSNTISSTYSHVRTYWQEMTSEMQRLEEENNRIFIEAYCLQDELTPEVPLKEITLTCNPHYRYGGNRSDDDLETMLKADTMKELISYAIGCMMGRYSLDEPGLIYAHSGNEGFDPNRYQTFPADDDGIVPIMDEDWFEDDASVRFQEFIATAWPRENLDENLRFIADSLGPKQGEVPIQTIRRFISTSFFKDYHLRVYKKRPIYWLFSSGKKRAFQCLVYLHRYNEATLSRMRGMYVTPLQGKYRARLEYLQQERDRAGSGSIRNKLEKELESMRKKQEELRRFDEVLRHYADQRISLDLDDGVKVNYGKFGDLPAEVKAVTGQKAEGL